MVRLASALVAAVLTACGTDAPAEPEQRQDADASAYTGCASDLPVFEPGLAAAEGDTKIALVEADPVTPSLFRNEWTLKVEGGTVSSVETFMPVHGHPGQPAPSVTALGDGRLHAELYFTMRGPWEARFDVGAAAPVVFQICVSE